MSGKRLIIVSHKNALRAIFKHLANISKEDIKRFQIPNALPTVFEFDADMKHVNNFCLMDKEAHSIKKDNPELSYNNIDWTVIKGEEYVGGFSLQDIKEESEEDYNQEFFTSLNKKII